MARMHRFESGALEHVDDRYIGRNPQQEATYEDELANAEVARAIDDLRSKPHLTQPALAELVGTTDRRCVVLRYRRRARNAATLGLRGARSR